jgi:hypothetical protein
MQKFLAPAAASRTRLGSLPKALPTFAYVGPVQAPGHMLSLMCGVAAHPQLSACMFYPVMLFWLEPPNMQLQRCARMVHRRPCLRRRP